MTPLVGLPAAAAWAVVLFLLAVELDTLLDGSEPSTRRWSSPAGCCRWQSA